MKTLFAVVALGIGVSSCEAQNREAGASQAGQASAPAALSASDETLYRDMARLSWRYLDQHYQSATGFVDAAPDYHRTTMWDLGGQFLAFQAARDLGLLSQDEFAKRMTKALETLSKAELYRGVAYNRFYSTQDGTMALKDGAGWSATDLGRFLLALKIIATREPSLAQLAERVARRVDMSQVVKGGYLYGEARTAAGKPNPFQEGRLGYEQYVARGFAAWGADVANALDVSRNARPVTVEGIALSADARGFDRLLSEPFILHGVELGLSGAYRDLATKVLAAQEARYKSSGQVTVVSEDAVAVKPHYFYYYCVYCGGKPFVVDIFTPGKSRDDPRWVSTKAAFGWHALMPNDYTRTAIAYVQPALDSTRGWASGVYEKTRASTATYDVNTASVLLEIAAYNLRGRTPLAEAKR